MLLQGIKNLSEQDRQYTYNVIQRLVYETVITVEKQYYIFLSLSLSLCLCVWMHRCRHVLTRA
jgi:hypothetical protein